MTRKELPMKQQIYVFSPPSCEPEIVLLDDHAREGIIAARRRVALLFMYLGSAVSLTFLLAAAHLH